MKLAVINWESGKVVNLIEYSRDVAYQLSYPLGFATRDCTNYPVCIGDDFDTETETFMRNGAPIEREATDAERIEQLEYIISSLAGGDE